MTQAKENNVIKNLRYLMMFTVTQSSLKSERSRGQKANLEEKYNMTASILPKDMIKALTILIDVIRLFVQEVWSIRL